MTKVQIHAEGIDPTAFDDSRLPTDIHLITYKKGEEVIVDAVRAYTKVDIFDEYYDKLKGEAEIISIESGFGKLRPNLYGKIETKE